VVPQIEAYAIGHGIGLADGWKVDVSKRVKTAILRSKEDPLAGHRECLEAWKKLFALIQPAVEEGVLV
jgi:hypothetical protein